MGFQSLFNEIREEASQAIWSAGVSLARQEKVSRSAVSLPDAAVFLVHASSRQPAFEVQLYPEFLDWVCPCEKEPVCEHVAAAVIAQVHAQEGGKLLPQHEAKHVTLSYRLSTQGGALTIARWAELPDGEAKPYPHLLRDGRRGLGAKIVESPGDLAVDLALGTWRSGRVPRADLVMLMRALVQVNGRITFNGKPVRASLNPLVPILSVEAAGRGFYVRLKPDPNADHFFSNGAALIDGELRLVDSSAGLSQGERRQLERGLGFDAEDALDLTDLIQDMEIMGIRVVDQTGRLPRGEVVAPRIQIEVEYDDGRMGVLATLVYGDPPIARIDRDKVTPLDGGTVMPLRDKEEERQLTRRLASRLGLELGRRELFEGQDGVAFARKLETFSIVGAQEGITLEGDDWELFALHDISFEPRVVLDDSGGFSVSFESEDGEHIAPEEVMKAWQRGWDVAPLSKGGFAPIPTPWLRQYGPLIANLLAAKNAQGDLPNAAVADVTQLAHEMGVPLPPRFERLQALIQDYSALPAPELPEDLTATLRPYQETGVAWLQFHREAGMGALLADDMGLGKTLQALCAVKGRTLIVAPRSVLHSWAKEARRFRPALSLSVYHGSKRELDPNVDLTLTTWSILRLDRDLLAAQNWDSVVLDEAQTIKNPDSQVARAAHALKADFRVCLTGTPVENRLEDLWSQMAFVEPGFLGERKAFVERYVQGILDGDAKVAESLRQRLKPFILRRLKRDVAPDLPPRTELVEVCELGDEERVLYQALRAAAQKEVQEQLAKGGSVLHALELLLRLRQAACHRGLIPGQGETKSSAKIELLKELLGDLVSNEHKVLVFSQWTSFLDLVEPHLKEMGLPFLRLDGATTQRQAVVDGFQSEDGPPILLLSLKAGGTGLTLTAADHVILLDPWWNPAVEDQAADRAHRIGQLKPVFVHRLVAADTVEERILELQERKRQLAEAALGAGSSASGAGLTREDLMALLS